MWDHNIALGVACGASHDEAAAAMERLDPAPEPEPEPAPAPAAEEQKQLDKVMKFFG